MAAFDHAEGTDCRQRSTVAARQLCLKLRWAGAGQASMRRVMLTPRQGLAQNQKKQCVV
jgi:hypothetical protein